jgi:hypothetical protein
LLAGCGSSAVAPPRYDPDAMARAAMAEYDTNHDGKLDAGELEACPALKKALPEIAKDYAKNKQPYLTEEDIAEELRLFEKRKVGLLSIRCKVVRGDGLGVAGVTVNFIPERFMGDAIKAGSGVSDQSGYVHPTVEGQTIPGLAFGFYRIEASRKDESGKETVPSQFNTNSKLGLEVHPRRMDVAIIQLD